MIGCFLEFLPLKLVTQDLQEFINSGLDILSPYWFPWRSLFLKFCSGKVSFPVSACLSNLGNSGLHCYLDSLIGLRRGDFQFFCFYLV